MVRGIVGFLSLASATLVALVSVAAVAVSSQVPTTIFDGVYSAGQATRGGELYTAHCRSCHGTDLDGGIDPGDEEPAPPLKGDRAMESLKRRRSLASLFDYVSASMPRDMAGTLGRAGYADVVAYLLQQNGMPAGRSDLRPDTNVLGAILTAKE